MVIVAENSETEQNLTSYLRAVGVDVTTGGVAALSSARDVTSFVIFPDDLAPKSVPSMLEDLLREHPESLLVVATSQLWRYAKYRDHERVLAVPRPVWGFRILDAIRAHDEARS